jgi:hypothetical protein
MPGLMDHCTTCAREYLYALPRCNVCRKAVCGNCIVRMGGSSFCSRNCANAFFYGSGEEAEEQFIERDDEDYEGE